MSRVQLEQPCLICGFREFYVASGPGETRKLRCAQCTAHHFESPRYEPRRADTAVAAMSESRSSVAAV
ncbi:hypothetical protein QO259_12135 [Salinicola sp. JS01]|uniref:hypothetical protein n=1 Tax=Salinicola sp. JS01 TaxID=3050071 RepID=UPI00255BA5C0|nr:hypothetical protein [Salinicola sp. JS01]WIX31566.1 hypothetical protein QO259_12135 [Salinicola sp. JS01]